MPRKRHISPDFFTHVELYEAEQAEGLPLRLAYAGLWCVADRRGRFEWHARRLKLDILPFDAVDFDLVLAALARHGFIRRYEVAGRVYGDIPTFLRHQHPHPRETDSRIPPYRVAPQHVGDASPEHEANMADASALDDAGMRHPPPGEPGGVSGPSEIQDPRRVKTLGASSPPAPRAPADPVAMARVCTDAANRGLLAALGEGVTILVASNQTGTVADWLAAGVEPDFAARVIHERALAYRPSATRRQPGSLAYFRAAVLEAWERECHRPAAAPPKAKKIQPLRRAG